MPRPRKGPRLYLRKRPGQEAVYYIRDGEAEISTGRPATDVDGAAQALRDYLADHFRPDTGERSLNRISCAEVLMLYFTDLPEDSPTRETIRYHIKALSAFWGEKSLADVKGSTCREYLKTRTGKLSSTSPPKKQPSSKTPSKNAANGKGHSIQRGIKPSTARQELKTFQSAINHWHRESPLSAVPKVTLPKPGERRARVLERHEVAALLWACRRLSRQGRKAANGAVQFTDYSHVSRFILIGLYTGTRHDAILKLRWTSSHSGGFIDLERGIIYRRGSSEGETSKRRPPCRIGTRLAAHLRRHSQSDSRKARKWVISFDGQPIAKMRRAWNTVRDAAKLGDDVTPHVLRHTCVSWHLWDGKTTWEVGQIVGADAATIDRVYGHHKLEGKVRGFVNPKTRNPQ